MSNEIYTSGEYLKRNPTWHADESPWKAQAVARMMGKNHLAPKTICEVGCGAGEILRLLQERMESDCTFWGYEISPQAFALCQTRANPRLQFQLADIQQEENPYWDVMLVMDVLEHLEDYFTFLRNLQPKSEYKIFHFPLDITVQSVLQGSVPRFRQRYGHLHYFTQELALEMLRGVNYEVLDYCYTRPNLWAPVPWHLIRDAPTAMVKRLLGNARRWALFVPAGAAFAVHNDLAARIFAQWRLLVLAK